mmetsp:Transcript_71/g.158  ORF Transcript_71/g.158 Transcript_71/m.158 type:complete len:317 (-) Transcript_71:173-1123(-)
MVFSGLVSAVVSAICNGTFGSLSKIDQCEQVHPYVFNFWTCTGIVFSSALILFDSEAWIFEPLGLLSGLLFVIATANSFAAISAVGLSIGSGIWCGTAVLISFTFGILVAGEKLHNLPLAVSAIAILLFGISGIAYSSYLSDRDLHSGGSEEDPLLPNTAGTSQAAKRVLGMVSAVLAGCFGGLIIAPMGYAPASHQGLAYLPSMGLGVLVSSPVVTAALLWSTSERPALLPKAAALPGAAAGAIWNIGNAASIIAVKDPSVGLAVAYPIMQCGLAVAGLWGVLLFREIRGRAQAVYWVSAAVLIGGASLLAMSKS